MTPISNREIVLNSIEDMRNYDFGELQFSPIGKAEKNHQAVLRKRARKAARLRRKAKEKAKNMALGVLFVACCAMILWAAAM